MGLNRASRSIKAFFLSQSSVFKGKHRFLNLKNRAIRSADIVNVLSHPPGEGAAQRLPFGQSPQTDAIIAALEGTGVAYRQKTTHGKPLPGGDAPLGPNQVHQGFGRRYHQFANTGDGDPQVAFVFDRLDDIREGGVRFSEACERRSVEGSPRLWQAGVDALENGGCSLAILCLKPFQGFKKVIRVIGNLGEKGRALVHARHRQAFLFGQNQVPVDRLPHFRARLLGGGDIKLPQGFIPFPAKQHHLKQKRSSDTVRRLLFHPINEHLPGLVDPSIQDKCFGIHWGVLFLYFYNRLLPNSLYRHNRKNNEMNLLTRPDKLYL
ncbi:hypothetical protein DESC_160012 [Desulfosarcina cetonica]|nr:hypothetical protein DESC_160012 [Desulfosarcina cetonica]